jgi:hypothetical protein
MEDDAEEMSAEDDIIIHGVQVAACAILFLILLGAVVCIFFAVLDWLRA